MLIDRYLLTIQVIPEKVEKVMEAVNTVVKMDYGKYRSVYYQSSEGQEFHKNPDEVMKQAESNLSVKIEFTIKQDEDLLHELISVVAKAHPWREPVIRVIRVRETCLE